MTHILKILDKFADSFFIGLNIFNTFEIRENGRHFHKGDYIRFRTVRNDGHLITHALNDQDYKIVYKESREKPTPLGVGWIAQKI